MLNKKQRFMKRGFDVFMASFLLLFSFWFIAIVWLIASFDTKSNGLFAQQRIGRQGKTFNIFKIKSMRPVTGVTTTVTSDKDPRITKFGYIWRKTKIDELPQLINIIRGDMSFVGPRPDVPGFADKLEGADRVILELRPGVTGPASIKYKNEEFILSQQKDPEKYNKEIIYPDKVNINKDYILNYSFAEDIRIILRTIRD